MAEAYPIPALGLLSGSCAYDPQLWRAAWSMLLINTFLSEWKLNLPCHATWPGYVSVYCTGNMYVVLKHESSAICALGPGMRVRTRRLSSASSMHYRTPTHNSFFLGFVGLMWKSQCWAPDVDVTFLHVSWSHLTSFSLLIGSPQPLIK